MATDILVKEKGTLDYFAPPEGSELNFYLQGNSRLRFFAFTFGKNSVKNKVNVIFKGENAKAELYGLYLPQKDQLIENDTFLHHLAPSGESFQQYCGILSGNGQALFKGRIFIERRAQKTSAYLESQNILLSKESKMLGRPHLEIFADDVKCTHAFVCRQIEDDEIFYLRSRGLGLKDAKKILLLGFAQRIINKVDSQALKNNLCAKISQFLTEGLEARN